MTVDDPGDAFQQFPFLETQNLLLRAIRAEDAEDLYTIFADKEVMRHYDLYPFETPEEADDLIEFFAESFELEKGIRWGITRKGEQKILGTCGYVVLRRYRGEIGYELAQAYWRQGIMSEALPAIINFGFQQLDLNRIEALVMQENAASAGLLTKLGFTEEGILREYDYFKESFHDLRCFSLLRREVAQ
jgi:ribosomal-protein-alanine N-acetyltransferase